MLILLDVGACEAQFAWAFHGNRLNATEVDFEEDANFPYYRFYFRLQRNVGVQLSWCTLIKAMVLQRTKYELDGQGIFQYVEWDAL